MQGDLDALCGIYAIINAVQICRPRLKRGEFFADLFDDLIKAAAPRASTFLLYGTGVADVARLLEAAKQSVKRRLTLCMSYSRPFRNGPPKSSPEYLHLVGQHVAGDNCACVIALSHHHFRYHWTAVQAVTKRSLRIVDSCDHQLIRRASLKIAGPGQIKQPGWWMPSATFLISINSTDRL